MNPRTARHPPSSHYDVLIVGGGPAACALALALRHHRPAYRILVIEKTAFRDWPLRIGENLPPATAVVLRQLALWKDFIRLPFLSSRGTQCSWGSSDLSSHDYLFQALGSGWQIDRKLFDQWLIRRAMRESVEYLAPYRLQKIEEPFSAHGDRAWRVSIAKRPDEHRAEIHARFLVDATGRAASLAKMLGAQRQAHDRLMAFYGYCTPAPVYDGAARVEASPQGWWYSGPLPDGKLVVAFMTDRDQAHALRLNQASAWIKHLQSSIWTKARVASFAKDFKPHSSAAHSQSLNPCCGPGWLAVGDAAGTYDPLSSLGLFKALRNGLLAAYATGDLLDDETQIESAHSHHPALIKYQGVMRAEFREYLSKRKLYYSMEQRFREHPFWQRRQSPNQ